MKEIRDVLNAEEEISQKVHYQVKERGENDRKRLAKVFKFSGPDHDTVSVLSNNASVWLHSPESFWYHPNHASWDNVPIEAEVVGSYIQTKRDDA